MASEYQAEEEGRRLRARFVPGGRGTCQGQREDLAGDREAHKVRGGGHGGQESALGAPCGLRKQDRSLDSSG